MIVKITWPTADEYIKDFFTYDFTSLGITNPCFYENKNETGIGIVMGFNVIDRDLFLKSITKYKITYEELCESTHNLKEQCITGFASL